MLVKEVESSGTVGPMLCGGHGLHVVSRYRGHSRGLVMWKPGCSLMEG
jgi:hypothetical protein